MRCRRHWGEVGHDRGVSLPQLTSSLGKESGAGPRRVKAFWWIFSCENTSDSKNNFHNFCIWKKRWNCSREKMGQNETFARGCAAGTGVFSQLPLQSLCLRLHKSTNNKYNHADIQDLPHGDTGQPQPFHHSMRLWVHSALLFSVAAIHTVTQDYFLEAKFLIHCS